MVVANKKPATKETPRFPEAFADHAARFYLGFRPARALALARMNLAARRTAEAYELALGAAVAAGEADCDLAAQAAALPEAGTNLRRLSERVCPPRG